MNNNEENIKTKRSYAKPEIQEVLLSSEEMVLAPCKTGSYTSGLNYLGGNCGFWGYRCSGAS